MNLGKSQMFVVPYGTQNDNPLQKNDRFVPQSLGNLHVLFPTWLKHVGEEMPTYRDATQPCMHSVLLTSLLGSETSSCACTRLHL